LEMASTGLHPTPVDHDNSFGDFGCQTAVALEEAAAALDLEPWIVDRLRHPEEESTSYLQLIGDSGDAACVPLFHVEHGAAHSAAIGSFSLLPDLQLRACQMMAMERTWQSALLGLPFGGASYGLVCDPDELSERELARLLVLAAQRLPGRRGRRSVIFPGRGCRREFMARAGAELSANCAVTLTGNLECVGGIDVNQFIAEGVAAVVLAGLRNQRKTPAEAKFALQGFGPLGQAISARLVSEGLTVVAVSDATGVAYRSDGLILGDIRAQVAREGVLFGYAEADRITHAEMLRTEADVLVLASGPNEIHGNNWNAVAASLVVEAEWNAVTATAKERLAAKGASVMPWLVATSGALPGAYFESRDEQIGGDIAKLLARTKDWVQQVFQRVSDSAAGNDRSLDFAARQIAVERVAECLRLCR